METIPKPGPWPTSLKWGIIGGILVVIITFLTHLNVDWSDYESYEAAQKAPLNYLSFVVVILAIVMAQLEHRKKDLGGFMSYGRGVGVATAASIGMGLCYAIILYIENGILHPEFQQAFVEGQLDRVGDIPRESEDMIIKSFQFSAKPGVWATFGFFTQVFIGLVVGLISSIFIQKSEQ